MTPIDARAHLADVLDAWVHPRQIMFRTQADLEALAARLAEGAAAVETIKRVEALIAGDARYVHHLAIRRAIDGPPQPDAAQVAESAQCNCTPFEYHHEPYCATQGK